MRNKRPKNSANNHFIDEVMHGRYDFGLWHFFSSTHGRTDELDELEELDVVVELDELTSQLLSDIYKFLIIKFIFFYFF